MPYDSMHAHTALTTRQQEKTQSNVQADNNSDDIDDNNNSDNSDNNDNSDNDTGTKHHTASDNDSQHIDARRAC